MTLCSSSRDVFLRRLRVLIQRPVMPGRVSCLLLGRGDIMGCVDDFLAQDYADRELLVLCDPDLEGKLPTGKLLGSDLIRLISLPFSLGSDVLRYDFLATVSSGAYVCVWDCGHESDPGRLSIQRDIMERHHARCVSSFCCPSDLFFDHTVLSSLPEGLSRSPAPSWAEGMVEHISGLGRVLRIAPTDHGAFHRHRTPPLPTHPTENPRALRPDRMDQLPP